jgi:hypothetical protein
MRVERGLAWKDIAAAFLEDETSDPATIDREAARLRQRYRSIRVGVKAALAKRKSQGSEPENR